MTSIGKVWTAGIAYVALAVGAGLSIMYNILDTMQVRGHQFDWADLVTAVAAPAIVLLMVEMFVSRIWVGQGWRIQIIRWMATVAIGGVAMRTSWTHGHDFMASRGQTEDVATMWPLAIDLLAIMATALILAGRTRGHVATSPEMAMATVAGQDGHGQEMATLVLDNGQTWTGPVATEVDQRGHGGHEPGQPYMTMVDEDMALATQPLSEEYAATLASELEAWGHGHDLAIRDAGRELAAQTEMVASIVPPEAVEMIRSWDGENGKAFDAQVAERFGRSARTARRWRSLVTGAPTSSG